MILAGKWKSKWWKLIFRLSRRWKRIHWWAYWHLDGSMDVNSISPQREYNHNLRPIYAKGGTLIGLYDVRCGPPAWAKPECARPWSPCSACEERHHPLKECRDVGVKGPAVKAETPATHHIPIMSLREIMEAEEPNEND